MYTLQNTHADADISLQLYTKYWYWKTNNKQQHFFL